MVYIDAAACIDCCACIPVCPVQAIYQEEDLPAEKRKWVDINKEKSKILPLITASTDPLPTAQAKRAALGY
jgi:ferredoxin